MSPRACAYPPCGKLFQPKQHGRRLFCSDACCAAHHVATRFPNRQSRKYGDAVEAALAHIRSRRGKVYNNSKPLPAVVSRGTPAPSIRVNAHVPGSIALAVLYGDGAIGRPLGRSEVSEVRPLRSDVAHVVYGY